MSAAFFTITETDILLLTIITSGIFAGWLSYLMTTRESFQAQNCIKSMLFGILFSLISTISIHALYGKFLLGIPSELQNLFYWCVSFLPAFVISLTYAVVTRPKRSVNVFSQRFMDDH
ncbi:MAG: hypothetical protein EOP06_27285 [Proteobacteria bacterium]|nr:MAG: hypothetical protein EOP06_27285 [Pseudomonadota bacterium]